VYVRIGERSVSGRARYVRNHAETSSGVAAAGIGGTAGSTSPGRGKNILR